MRTLFPRALESLIYFREIIPLYGRTIQVSELISVVYPDRIYGGYMISIYMISSYMYNVLVMCYSCIGLQARCYHHLAICGDLVIVACP